jgi:hypothetical protein
LIAERPGEGLGLAQVCDDRLMVAYRSSENELENEGWSD